MREVGALLDAKAVHPCRTAYDHLRCLARSDGIPAGGSTRCSPWSGWSRSRGAGWGTYSLGMSQRLGIAGIAGIAAAQLGTSSPCGPDSGCAARCASATRERLVISILRGST